MKRILPLVLTLIIGAIAPAHAASIPRERQIEIIQNYMLATGQTLPASWQALGAQLAQPARPPVKCGMSAVANFVLNRDKLDPELLRALGTRAYGRPTYDDERTHDTPAGLFKIHYTTSGVHAVYRASSDRDGDGVPDYVEDMGLILDWVHAYIIDTLYLGYPPPPVDSFYATGGDEKYDVYVLNLWDTLGAYYGFTQPDSLSVDGPGSLRATSYMGLENDYKELADYRNRPLDAVRVTCAHEYFHAVHFGIDYREAEGGDFSLRYWMEMSATWMEEEIYDDINDYYNYLPFFFNYPRQSLQQFLPDDWHPYGAVVFPIFLSENFGRDIIKDIWLRCGSMGAGPHFLIATEQAVDSVIGDTMGMPTVFRDFALWNYFTGERACYAPDSIGYSERERYPAIPDSEISRHTYYPLMQLANKNTRSPEHNAAAYLHFDHLRAVRTDSIGYDTSAWVCRVGSFPSCLDSQLITVRVDTLATMYLNLQDDFVPPQDWGLNAIVRLDSIPDSFAVDQYFLPYGAGIEVNIPYPNRYRNVTLIISPASYVRQAYHSPPYDSLGYYIPELLDSTRLDTPIIIDSQWVELPAAILAPYPNPAVVGDMGGSPLKFKFQVATDSFSNLIFPQPSFTVDIFNVAGEYVRGFTSGMPHFCDKHVQFTVSWDMKNEWGEEVASGVYIAVGRLYSSPKKRQLLAEDKVKVALIR